VRERRRLAEEWSGGRLGNIHIQGMNTPSFEEFERMLFTAADGKEGLLIDVRSRCSLPISRAICEPGPGKHVKDTMTLRSTIRAAVLLMTVVAASNSVCAQQTPTPFGASVDVTRILTEVRVVDDAGHPITDLGPKDFRIKISGTHAEVEAVTWIPTTSEAAALVSTPQTGDAPSDPPLVTPNPRLIVVLFQTDINLYRIKGVVRMAPQAADFVRNLSPSDRVAFLTFESHLELRSDFTVDHEALAEMITTTEILDSSIEPPLPSTLRSHL